MTRTDTDPGFKRYFRTILQYPLLTADEEDRLVSLWRDGRNLDAQHQLITSHLRLVPKIALSFRGYGLPLPELVSEGQIGLIEAVNRFEPGHGSRLATYAVWWIRSAIQEYILRSWSLVRMGTTAAHKRLFFSLRATKARLQAIEGGAVAPDQVARIAQLLKVRESEVIRMDGWLSGRDQSLNVPLSPDSDTEWQDQLVDERENQETTFGDREEAKRQHMALDDALEVLTPRERHILTARRLTEHPPKLQELTAEYGISCERVRQVEVQAFAKIKQALSHRAQTTATAGVRVVPRSTPMTRTSALRTLVATAIIALAAASSARAASDDAAEAWIHEIQDSSSPPAMQSSIAVRRDPERDFIRRLAGKSNPPAQSSAIPVDTQPERDFIVRLSTILPPTRTGTVSLDQQVAALGSGR